MAAKEIVNILIVDDKPSNLLALEAQLEDDDRQIITASSGNQALGLLFEYDFALVILDIQMPEINGIETAKIMRKNKKTRQTPIIFVTAINKNEHHIFEGYNAGAVDYIFKPVEPIILKSKTNVLIQLYRQKITIEKTNKRLKKMVRELEAANRKILIRHKNQIEEERLKIIMQLAGASANEMNQPLMNLLNHIELLQTETCGPSNQALFLKEIKKSGEQIYKLAKHIQSMQISNTEKVPVDDISPKITKMISVLIVCRAQDDFNRLNSHLVNSSKMKISGAETIRQTLAKAANEQFDLIITDYCLADGTGFDLMERLKEKSMDLPVIFVASNGDEAVAAQAIKKGAYDYLSRADLNKESLNKALSNALEKDSLQKEIVAAYQRLADLSTRDSLTKLYNRRYFNEAVETEISKVKRYGSPMSLCMVDLDHFKHINDQFGHLTGDKVLSKTADILSDLVRECDVVCRYGGEEFGLILPKTFTQDAFSLGERIRKSIETYKYKHEKNNIGITVSIGIASCDRGSRPSLSSLVNQADKALYLAKSRGRNRVEIYNNQQRFENIIGELNN